MAGNQHGTGLTEAEVREIVADELQAQLPDGVSRRQALQAGGILGLGALIGGGGASAALDGAAADADPNDNDGDVGQPGNRIDIFADGVDVDSEVVWPDGSTTTTSPGGALSDSGTDNSLGGDVYELPQATDGVDVGSVTTGALSVSGGEVNASLNGRVVPVSNDLGVGDAIDPSNTTTPVQDAIDMIGRSSGGAVLFPPTGITESGTVVGTKNKQFIGWGVAASGLAFSDTSVAGIGQDPNVSRDCTRSYWDGIRFSGTDNTRTTPAILWDTHNVSEFYVGVVDFLGWGDPIIEVDGQQAPFDSWWGIVRFDSTCNGRPFYIHGSGAAWGGSGFTGGIIQCRVNNGSHLAIDASDSAIAGVRFDVGQIAVEGSLTGIDLSGVSAGAGLFAPRQLNFEASVTVTGELFTLKGPIHIPKIDVLAGTADYVWSAEGGAEGYIGHSATSNATINNNVGNISGANPGTTGNVQVRADELSADIGNSDGSENQHVRALRDDRVVDVFSGTVTLTGGATPAARINGNFFMQTETEAPVVQRLTPTGTGPAADYGFDHSPVWDDSGGQWDIRVDWTVDPGGGNDVEVAYELLTSDVVS